MDQEKKIFNDPVHGLIELDPLLVKIIDTPEFQRLRYIKQLGMSYLVYPGASHNRFEHSIGVCHLAGMFVEELKRKQGLNIEPEDILCIKIAGLCHDLGHGPFSHLFDTSLVPEALKEWTGKEENKFKHHEERSRLILEHLIVNNNLEKCFEDRGLKEKERQFIGNLITASLKEKKDIGDDWKDKKFLFEIVANEDSGIDVDKWDYFARDCHMLGISNNFDHMRCMKLARVIKTDTGMRICFRDKEVFNLYEMFHTRYTLHLRAYQHKTVKIIDNMMKDVLLKADKHLKFGNEKKTMSTIICDMDCTAFCLLTDEIVSYIWNPAETGLDDARCLLENIRKRELYKFVGATRITFDQEHNEEFKKHVKELEGESKEALLFKLDYGKKNENPVDSVMFYRKGSPDKAIKINKEEVSYLIPQHMYEKHVLLIYKGKDFKSVEGQFKEKFRGWCTKYGYPIVKDSNARKKWVVNISKIGCHGPRRENITKVSSSLDPDETLRDIACRLNPNCLQPLSQIRPYFAEG